MATVMRFPTEYPVRQWQLRLKIEGLLDKLGWDMDRCMMGFSADTADRWPLLDDESLRLMVDYLQEEYMLTQCTPKQAAAHTEAAPAKRPARRIAFPVTPEMEARQKTVQAAKPEKAGAAKAERQAVRTCGARGAQPQGLDQVQADKAKYIRRVKMLQRDCEKALPRFDDGTYRAILAAQFDAETSKALSVPQLRALLLYMKGLLRQCQGPGKAGPTVSFDAPALLYNDASGLNRCGSMRKIQALLAEKGKVEGKYIRWSYALSILKRQTKGVVAEWEDASPRQLDAVIAALSRDAQRKGRRAR